MDKKIIGIVLALIIVGAGSFYGGMKYAASKMPVRGNFAGGQFPRTGADARGGFMANGGFVAGEILSKDANGITLKLRDGGSKIVLMSDSTQILKSDEGLKDDLVVGGEVTITGKANTDGSINAMSVQIRPGLPKQ